MPDTFLETALKRFWQVHQCLTAAGHTETAAMLVEIAVEYAYAAGVAAAMRSSAPHASDIRAEATKILGTLREAERYCRDERFSAESFKALLRLIYRKEMRAIEHPEQHRKAVETGETPAKATCQNDRS